MGSQTFAFANICGGIILSGPKACRGSTKEARTYRARKLRARPRAREYKPELTLAAFLHSLLIEVGIGLLSPKGMVLVFVKCA